MVYFTVQSPSNYFPTPRSTLHSTRGTRAVLSTVLAVLAQYSPQYSRYSRSTRSTRSTSRRTSHDTLHSTHSTFYSTPTVLAVLQFSSLRPGSRFDRIPLFRGSSATFQLRPSMHRHHLLFTDLSRVPKA